LQPELRCICKPPWAGCLHGVSAIRNCSRAAPIAAGYSAIAAKHLQLQPGILVLQPIGCNCIHATPHFLFPPTYNLEVGRARCTVHSQTCNCSRVRGAPQGRAADEEALTRPFTVSRYARCSWTVLARSAPSAVAMLALRSHAVEAAGGASSSWSASAPPSLSRSRSATRAGA